MKHKLNAYSEPNNFKNKTLLKFLPEILLVKTPNLFLWDVGVFACVYDVVGGVVGLTKKVLGCAQGPGN